MDQPFFNTSDTREQRMAFIRDLSVTHVLITPPLYRGMKPLLDADRSAFVPRYDDGRWAIYEVRRP